MAHSNSLQLKAVSLETKQVEEPNKKIQQLVERNKMNGGKCVCVCGFSPTLRVVVRFSRPISFLHYLPSRSITCKVFTLGKD